MKKAISLLLVLCVFMSSLCVCAAEDTVLPQVVFDAFYSEEDSRFEITTEIQSEGCTEKAQVMAAVYKNGVFYNLLLNENINKNTVYNKKITRYSIVPQSDDPKDFEFRCFTLGENLKPLLPAYTITGEKAMNNASASIVKLSGVVTETSVASLRDWSFAVDTTEDATVYVDITDTFDTTNRDFPSYGDGSYAGDINRFLVGDSNIEDYLGMAVIMYVKKNKAGMYEVVSVAEDSAKNNIVSFSLDRFDVIDGDYFKYFKNSTDPSSAKVNLSRDCVAALNGTAVPYFDDIFGFGAVVEENGKCTKSGTVTLIDNGGETGYDVVMVEVGAAAVVDEVSDGVVSFKESVRLADDSAITQLSIDENATHTVIDIIKGGKKIPYTELREWDVLSIVAPQYYGEYGDGYVRAEVISNSVTGSITAYKTSRTSATGRAYKIDDKFYDVAEGAYRHSNLGVNDTGIFYIDKCGKLAAFKSEQPKNYGYVYDTLVTDMNMDGEVLVKMITDNGAEILKFAPAVTICYRNMRKSTFRTNDLFDENFAYSDANLVYSATGSITDLSGDYTVKNLVGNVIKYTKNSAGEIRTITLSAYDDDFEKVSLTPGNYTYKADMGKLGKFIDEDSLIFFIGNSDETCSIGSTADLLDNNAYNVVGMYRDYTAYDNNIVVINGEKPNSGDDDFDEQETAPVYGYVYNTLITDKSMDTEVLVQMITDNGVELMNFASSVTVNYNNNNKSTFKVSDLDDRSINANDANLVYDSILDISTVSGNYTVRRLVGTVIKYTKNSAGDIKTITLSDCNDDFEKVSFAAGNYTYEADTGKLGDFVATDSKVFFISTSANNCAVGTLANLTDGSDYSVAALYKSGSATNCNIIVINGEKPNSGDDFDEQETAPVYGFVYDTLITDKSMDTEVLVKMITDNGVELMNFASSVTVNYNNNNKSTFKVSDLDDRSITANDANLVYDSILDISTVSGNYTVRRLVGTVIKYTKNSSGDIKTITLSDCNDGFEKVSLTAGSYTYDADTNMLGKPIDENSLIFFIDNIDRCYTGTAADLSDLNAYDVIGMYRDSNSDDNNIIVIRGNSCNPSKAANLAVITEVSYTEDEDGNDSIILSYMTGGQTFEDVQTIADATVDGGNIYDLTAGDLVRIKTNSAGKITGIAILWNMDEDVRTGTVANYFTQTTAGDAEGSDGEVLYGGAVTAARDSSKVYFGTDVDWSSTTAIRDQDIDWVYIGKAKNVYTIQTARDGIVSVKKGGSFNYVKQMFDNIGTPGYTNRFVYDGDIVYGTAGVVNATKLKNFVDHVFVREYNGIIEDAVIVKTPKSVSVKIVADY